MLPQSSEPQKPTVWNWYVTYCVAMAVLHLLVVAAGFVVLFTAPATTDRELTAKKFLSSLYIVLGFVFLIPYAAGPLLPRRKWAWVMGLVLICFGMTSVCCLPAAVPLLIWWIKPETKEYYYHDGPGAETSAKPLNVANVTHKKCPGCGLNNVPTAAQCERCDTALAS
jgi:uncharacterized membrane protein